MKSDFSIFRSEQYKIISKLVLNGTILDLGGSKKSGYHELLKGVHKIITANIDPETGCDLIFDIQDPFPIKDNEIDHVICLNVLEHVFRFQNVFPEVFRVLKKGGNFILTVPFMYQIHNSPDDFFRYTKSSLSRLLKDNGFKIIKIEEIGLGLFSLFFQILGGAFPMLVRNFLKKFCIMLDKFFLRFSKRYRRLSHRIPLGYFVIAKK
ncbi:MAG: methyltransferase domain-containing protein [candidate division WOR-3 bacterium]